MLIFDKIRYISKLCFGTNLRECISKYGDPIKVSVYKTGLSSIPITCIEAIDVSPGNRWSIRIFYGRLNQLFVTLEASTLVTTLQYEIQIYIAS